MKGLSGRLIDLILWIAVLPVSFMFAYSINLLVAMILGRLVSVGQGQMLFPLLEITLFPFLMSLVVIWASYKIMPVIPVRKLKALIVVAIIIFVSGAIGIFLPEKEIIRGVISIISSTIGILVGLHIVIRKISPDTLALTQKMTK